MSSINLTWFADNWFRQPNKPSRPPNFAFISSNHHPIQKPSNHQNPKLTSSSTLTDSSPPIYTQMLDQFYWECENRPDHRNSPQIDQLLSDDPIFENPENLSPEKIKEDLEWWEEFKKSPVVKFMMRAEEIADGINERELRENQHPYHWEDRKLWKALPYVPGLDGRPMPRKAIKTRRESDEKFWDFARQFFFGLWGFRQRPYPSSRPIDVAQAIGYKNLERRYYDCEFVSSCCCAICLVESRVTL